MNSLVNSIAPPPNLQKCIGIICNGEIEITGELIQKVKSCEHLIGVDGGLNHCAAMKITPQWAVGDFDSVNAEIFEIYKGDLAKLQRAKDQTDLEVALEKAKALSTTAQIVIFGGLGGRLDHTLSNLCLLLREPTRIFLESEHQVVFGINENNRVEIEKGKWKSVAFIPLNGPAEGITLTAGKESYNLPVVDKSKIFRFPLPENSSSLTIQKGELIVILEKEESPLPHLPSDSFKTHFRLTKPLINTFHELFQQSRNMAIRLHSDEGEELFNLGAHSGNMTFPVLRGLTVSLIPFYGAAKGIRTQGLKWEFGKDITELTRDFVGISNVSMGDSFSIEVKEGELLCILNHKVIDEEMVTAEKTS